MTYKKGVRPTPVRVLLLTVLGASVISCTNKAQQHFERPPAPVAVTEAVAQDVPTYLDAIGKTVAREVVAIQPQVSGRIMKLHFTDGANVRKNDLLFTIDTRPFEAALKQAQANLSRDEALKKQSEANLAKEITQAKFGDVQVRRYRTLVEQGVVSREQYDELKANLDALNANVDAARSAVNSAGEAMKVDAAAIESAKVNLSYCYIRSPIDGRAGQRLVDVGNVVNPGGSGSAATADSAATPPSNALLVIERLDPIYADFTISQSSLPAVQDEMRKGSLRTEVRLPETSNDPVSGTLTFVDNSVQQTTGTISLRATIPNNGHQFWPGRFVNVRLILSTIHQAVLIPATAPQTAATGLFVYVVKADSTAEQRPVTLGQRQGDLIVVEQGLQAGEKVVTAGQIGVTPGGKVALEAAKPAGAAQSGGNGSK